MFQYVRTMETISRSAQENAAVSMGTGLDNMDHVGRVKFVSYWKIKNIQGQLSKLNSIASRAREK